MKTSEQQTLQFGGEQLSYSQEEIHANQVVVRAKGRVKQMTAIYGRNIKELLLKYAQKSLLMKMCWELLKTESWTKRSATWKLLGTPGGRPLLYLQVRSGQITKETGFGLLPTLTASEWKGVPKNRFYGSKTYRSDKLASRFRKHENDSPLLNPDYAELFMGYPKGHTDLKH